MSAHRWNRLTGVGLSAAITLLAVAACGSDDNEASGADGAIRIAVIADQTGPLAVTLGEASAGFRAAMADLGTFGADDLDVDVEYFDSQTDPALGAQVFRDALSSDPDAIVYAGSSSTLGGVESLLAQQQVPVLTYAAPDAMVYPPRDNLFMFGPTAAQVGAGEVSMAKQLLDGQLQGKKLAVLTSKTAYSDSAVLEIESLESVEGFSVVAKESIELGAGSATSQAQAIAAASPDAVLLAVAGGDAPTAIGALQSAGVKAPMVSYHGASSSELFELLKAPNFYALRAATVPAAVPEMMQAASKGKVEKQANTDHFTQGWIMANAMVEAADRCGATCDGSTLLEVFQDFGEWTPALDTSFGPYKIDADSHAGATAMQAFVWDAAETAPVPWGEPVSIYEVGS